MGDPRPEKVAVVDEVRERLDRADAAILTEYRGLTVKDLAALRRSLREAGGEYRVYKNTLVRFAARDLGLADLEPLLTGPTGITFVDRTVDGGTVDAALVAKALREYARANPRLVVKGGVLGRRVMSAADTTTLADLPSREVVLARLAGALAAPMQQFAGLLQALPRNFAYGLKALLDQGGVQQESAGAAEADSAGSTATTPTGEAEPAPTGDTQPPSAGDAESAPTSEAEPTPTGDAEPAPTGDTQPPSAGDAAPAPTSDAEPLEAAPGD